MVATSTNWRSVEDVASPVTLVPASASRQDIAFAASACVRYSDEKKNPLVKVVVMKGGGEGRVEYELNISPASDNDLDRVRIIMPQVQL